MPRVSNERRSIKGSGHKPVRLRIRSDSEINRLSGIALDKENEKTANKTEVTKKMKDDLVEKEVELSTVNDSKSKEADNCAKKDRVDDDTDYYKKAYEECRAALSTTLEENERLYDEMDLLKAENDQLRQIIEQVVAEEAIIPWTNSFNFFNDC